MRKIFIFLALFILCANSVFAQNRIELIYINGSNNNDLKMTKWFYKGISKFHPVLRETLTEDDFYSKVEIHGIFGVLLVLLGLHLCQ